MVRVVNNEKWGRENIGAHTVIGYWIVAAKADNADEVPLFLLARDGKVMR